MATHWEAIRRRCPGFSARRARARPAHRWTRTYERFGLAGACWLALAPLGHADQGWEGNSLHLTWENDATRGSDRHYTQGAKIRYLSADDIVPKWTQSLSDLLPTPGFEADRVKFLTELGQEIYTPEDLSATALLPRDRPYAGWFYLGLGLQRRGLGPGDVPVLEHLRLDVGVVGRESLAEDTQKVWHGQDPQGWDHQLKSEVAFALRYERSYLLRIPISGLWTFDAMPGTEAALGTLDVHLGLNAAARVGYHIPNRHEVPIERTRPGFGAYFFGSLGGQAIARNLFLDGNTWRQSHHVTKEPLVGRMSAGVALILGPVEISASHNYVTREFRHQNNPDSYGSATVTFKF